MSFNVLQFYQDYSVPYWTKGKNVTRNWINIKCPFCKDQNNHLGYNLSKDYFNCYRCGKQSTVDVVMNLLGLPYQSAQITIDQYTNEGSIRLSMKQQSKKIVEAIELPGEKLNSIHRKYLENRHFNPDRIENIYHLKGTGITGDWKFRIIIPIYYHDRLVTFTSRDVTGKQFLPKKTLSEEKSIMNPKHCLFNFDSCKQDYIGVLEGPFDVFRMGENFCATLGTSLTEQQIKLLSSFKRVFFIFDSEKEAQNKAKKYAMQLSALGCRTEVIDLENRKDPAELSEKEATEIKMELGFL